MKVWVLEQRVRQLEFEVLRQDNKISNLSDKFVDLKLDNSKPPRSRRQNRGTGNRGNMSRPMMNGPQGYNSGNFDTSSEHELHHESFYELNTHFRNDGTDCIDTDNFIAQNRESEIVTEVGHMVDKIDNPNQLQPNNFLGDVVHSKR